MPSTGDFSCFKSKSNASIKQQSEQVTASSVINQRNQSKISIVDRFRSFESIFNSCLKSNQSSSNEKRRSTKNKYIYDNNHSIKMPTSKTNETFSNDDEEPPPTVSTASYSSVSSTNLNKQKSLFDVANQQVSLKVDDASNQKFSDESFRNLLLVC
jgi:hypothetical protein